MYDVRSTRNSDAVIYNGQVSWIPAGEVEAYCAIDESKDANCTLTYGSWVQSQGLLDFQPGKVVVTPSTQNPCWEAKKTSIWKENTVYPCCPDVYPRIKVSFVIRNIC